MGPRGIAFSRENLIPNDVIPDYLTPDAVIHNDLTLNGVIPDDLTPNGVIHNDLTPNGVIHNDLTRDGLNSSILVAYCGIPHVSSDINKRWVNRFLSGMDRDKWREIIALTHQFALAVKQGRYRDAGELMNRETRIRMEMTPDVLDKTGQLLFQAALECGCGARFTGAGGGGCLWAIGNGGDVEILGKRWKDITDNCPAPMGKKDEISTWDRETQAGLLNTKIDFKGIL
ncbi:MAG: hypothetical protein HQK66_02770 [Desulfamplus sp.]|nr:hypothetical protein [Desulfamplus sp.]